MDYKVIIEQDDMVDSPDDWGNYDNFLLVGYGSPWREIKRPGIDAYDVLNRKRYEYNGKKYYVFRALTYRAHGGISLCYHESDHANSAVLVEVAHYTRTRAQAEKVAEDLVETWRMWAAGEIYMFRIEDSTGEIVDSCGGFYGYKAAEDEANTMLEYLQREDKDNICPLELVYSMEGGS